MSSDRGAHSGALAPEASISDALMIYQALSPAERLEFLTKAVGGDGSAPGPGEL